VIGDDLKIQLILSHITYQGSIEICSHTTGGH